MDKKNTFSAKMGQLVGCVLVACISACITAVAIALTVRFIAFLF